MIYNIKQNQLSVYNSLNINQSFTMNASGNVYTPIEIFAITARYFNTNTNYNTLLSGFHNQFIAIDEKDEKTKIEKQIIHININGASQEELASLPGINVATAKKAIKYREENKGFKTRYEFYRVTKLKQRYIDMIHDSLFIGEYNVLNEYEKEEIENKPQEGREIDF